MLAAITLAVLSSYASGYDRNQSIGEEWQQRGQTEESQKIEQGARQREIENSNRMQQLEHQQRLQQQENERRQRQLEAEQFRLWLWSRRMATILIWLRWEIRDCRAILHSV